MKPDDEQDAEGSGGGKSPGDRGLSEEQMTILLEQLADVMEGPCGVAIMFAWPDGGLRSSVAYSKDGGGHILLEGLRHQTARVERELEDWKKKTGH